MKLKNLVAAALMLMAGAAWSQAPAVVIPPGAQAAQERPAPVAVAPKAASKANVMHKTKAERKAERMAKAKAGKRMITVAQCQQMQVKKSKLKASHRAKRVKPPVPAAAPAA